MTDELHADAMKRKEKTMGLVRSAHNKLLEIDWINPNGYPVYLDHNSVLLLRNIQANAAAILAKHEEAEKELAGADRL